MTKQEEQVFERKAEAMLQGHRQAPDGRDYRAFSFNAITRQDRDNYRRNFDAVFPNAPGKGM